MLHRRILLLCPPLVLLALLLWWKSQDHSTTTASSKSVSAKDIPAEVPSPDGFLAYEDWRKTHPGKQLDEAALAEGLRLATARQQRMRELIARDPARALEEAVTRSEYEALPEVFKPLFERPFNSVATLQVLPVCGQHGHHEHAEGHDNIHSLLMDGRSFAASVYGQRLAQGTKEGTPLSGITLDNLAAISELPLEVPAVEDLAALSILPVANPDPTRDFATGELLGGHPVTALAGGRLFLFRNLETLEAFNRRLAKLDETPGPHGGSRYVLAAKVAADGDAGAGPVFDWQDAEQQAEVAASTWTETTKNVFFIRVDFSDKPGEVVTQANLSNVLNNSVSDCIEQMSYNKTSINATVSATTVRMPQPASYYLPSNNDQLLADAKTAYKLIAGSTALDGYNIVGVHFPDINITSGGMDYAGLASVGGSNHWLQGTSNSGVIIHEFGHNYGLSHASYWQTNDGSVVGPGAYEEYGDVFDIMGDGPDPAGHFHPQGKSKLNWLTTAQWFDAASSAASGVRRIYRFDDPATTGTLRAIRVKKSATDFYWVGYRPDILGNVWLNNGAYLIWERPNQTRSYLLDTTPGTTNGKNDSAIDIGTTYSDIDAITPVHITPIAKGGSGADAWLDVNVQIGTFVGNQLPTASITAPASLEARKPLIFTASATDPNGDTLAYEWDFGDGSPSANASATQHTWMLGGSYTVKLTVSDMKGGKVTQTANVTVTDPFTQAWTKRTSGTTSILYDVAVGGGRVVAVGDKENGISCRYSTDGGTWSGTAITNAYLRSIVYDGTQFIACGYDYDFNDSTWKGAIFTSANATSWTRRHLSGAYLRSVAYGNGVYVAGGDGGALWRSTDNGVNWSPVSAGVSSRINGVSYAAGKFVAVCSGGAVVTSTLGNSWADISSGAGIGSEDLWAIDYVNDRFFIGSYYNPFWYSKDGLSYTPDNLSLNLDMKGFAYGNGVYFAAGLRQVYVPPNPVNEWDLNLISMNGVNWTTSPVTSQDDRNAAVFFNNTFITVGENGSIWQSPTFTAAAPTYPGWVASNFAANPPLSGPNEDYDGDGVSNLGEYATGTNARNASSRANITNTRANGELTLTVPKAANVSDVIYSVQYSTDMVNWSGSGFTIVENSASQIVAKVTANGGKGFLRVVFTVAP